MLVIYEKRKIETCEEAMNLYAVVLAGGKGERFWPMSRSNLPKQFIRLFGKDSLVVATAKRIGKLVPIERQYFVLSKSLSLILKKQIRISRKNIIYEPVGKNTAPAIGLAVAYLEKIDPQGTVIVLPADHIIKDTDKFCRCVKFAYELAQKDYLITFGIPPTAPETGYGYINIKEEFQRDNGLLSYKVWRFVEKPDIKTAQKYLKSGKYFWNSGMFVFKIKTILDAYKICLPDFYRHLKEYQKHIGTKTQNEALNNLYYNAPATSIDYAVLEKVSNIIMIKANFYWDDVGSWLALERHFSKDSSGNVILGDVVNYNTQNSIIVNDKGLIATMGIDDLVVVRNQDVILVMSKAQAMQLKELIKEIAKNSRFQKYL
ncbi:MAG: mannose-1-phosphate guanylyltransferase [candidate division WOR-3 bacterium]|nr:mannose-1-phosphate guanylyltransferase [candidate division WOR-3 bacterium]